jgi:pseudouridine-5'-phosphate glycosidase
LSIEIRADTREALREGKPVVGLESTLISYGLPRPENLNVAREAKCAEGIRVTGYLLCLLPTLV